MTAIGVKATTPGTSGAEEARPTKAAASASPTSFSDPSNSHHPNQHNHNHNSNTHSSAPNLDEMFSSVSHAPFRFFCEKDPTRFFRLPSSLMDSWEFRKIASEGSVLPNAFCTHVLYETKKNPVSSPSSSQHLHPHTAAATTTTATTTSRNNHCPRTPSPMRSHEKQPRGGVKTDVPPPQSASQTMKDRAHPHPVKDEEETNKKGRVGEGDGEQGGVVPPSPGRAVREEEEELEALLVGTTEGCFFVLYPRDEVREPVYVDQLTGTISIVLYAREEERLVLVTLEGTCVVHERFAHGVLKARRERNSTRTSAAAAPPLQHPREEERNTSKNDREEEGHSRTRERHSFASFSLFPSEIRAPTPTCRRFRVAANCFCGDFVRKTPFHGEMGVPVDGRGGVARQRGKEEETVAVPGEDLRIPSRSHSRPPPKATSTTSPLPGSGISSSGFSPSDSPCGALLPSSINSPPFTYLLLGSMDRFIYLYDMEQGALLLSLYMHHPVTDVKAFSAPLSFSPPLSLPPLLPHASSSSSSMCGLCLPPSSSSFASPALPPPSRTEVEARSCKPSPFMAGSHSSMSRSLPPSLGFPLSSPAKPKTVGAAGGGDTTAVEERRIRRMGASLPTLSASSTSSFFLSSPVPATTTMATTTAQASAPTASTASSSFSFSRPPPPLPHSAPPTLTSRFASVLLVATPVSLTLLSADVLLHPQEVKRREKHALLPLVLADPVALHRDVPSSSAWVPPASHSEAEGEGKDVFFASNNKKSMIRTSCGINEKEGNFHSDKEDGEGEVSNCRRKRHHHYSHSSKNPHHPCMPIATAATTSTSTSKAAPLLEEEKQTRRRKRENRKWEWHQANQLLCYWECLLHRALLISPMWMVYIHPQGVLMVPPLWDVPALTRMIHRALAAASSSSSSSSSLSSICSSLASSTCTSFISSSYTSSRGRKRSRKKIVEEEKKEGRWEKRRGSRRRRKGKKVAGLQVTSSGGEAGEEEEEEEGEEQDNDWDVQNSAYSPSIHRSSSSSGTSQIIIRRNNNNNKKRKKASLSSTTAMECSFHQAKWTNEEEGSDGNHQHNKKGEEEEDSDTSEVPSDSSSSSLRRRKTTKREKAGEGVGRETYSRGGRPAGRDAGGASFTTTPAAETKEQMAWRMGSDGAKEERRGRNSGNMEQPPRPRGQRCGCLHPSERVSSAKRRSEGSVLDDENITSRSSSSSFISSYSSGSFPSLDFSSSSFYTTTSSNTDEDYNNSCSSGTFFTSSTSSSSSHRSSTSKTPSTLSFSCEESDAKDEREGWSTPGWRVKKKLSETSVTEEAKDSLQVEEDPTLLNNSTSPMRMAREVKAHKERRDEQKEGDKSCTAGGSGGGGRRGEGGGVVPPPLSRPSLQEKQDSSSPSPSSPSPALVFTSASSPSSSHTSTSLTQTMSTCLSPPRHRHPSPPHSFSSSFFADEDDASSSGNRSRSSSSLLHNETENKRRKKRRGGSRTSLRRIRKERKDVHPLRKASFRMIKKSSQRNLTRPRNRRSMCGSTASHGASFCVGKKEEIERWRQQQDKLKKKKKKESTIQHFFSALTSFSKYYNYYNYHHPSNRSKYNYSNSFFSSSSSYGCCGTGGAGSFSASYFNVRTSVDVGVSAAGGVQIFVVMDDGRAFALHLRASVLEGNDNMRRGKRNEMLMKWMSTRMNLRGTATSTTTRRKKMGEMRREKGKKEEKQQEESEEEEEPNNPLGRKVPIMDNHHNNSVDGDASPVPPPSSEYLHNNNEVDEEKAEENEGGRDEKVRQRTRRKRKKSSLGKVASGAGDEEKKNEEAQLVPSTTFATFPLHPTLCLQSAPSVFSTSFGTPTPTRTTTITSNNNNQINNNNNNNNNAVASSPFLRIPHRNEKKNHKQPNGSDDTQPKVKRAKRKGNRRREGHNKDDDGDDEEEEHEEGYSGRKGGHSVICTPGHFLLPPSSPGTSKGYQQPSPLPPSPFKTFPPNFSSSAMPTDGGNGGKWLRAIPVSSVSCIIAPWEISSITSVPSRRGSSTEDEEDEEEEEAEEKTKEEEDVEEEQSTPPPLPHVLQKMMATSSPPPQPPSQPHYSSAGMDKHLGVPEDSFFEGGNDNSPPPPPPIHRRTRSRRRRHNMRHSPIEYNRKEFSSTLPLPSKTRGKNMESISVESPCASSLLVSVPSTTSSSSPPPPVVAAAAIPSNPVTTAPPPMTAVPLPSSTSSSLFPLPSSSCRRRGPTPPLPHRHQVSRKGGLHVGRSSSSSSASSATTTNSPQVSSFLSLSIVCTWEENLKVPLVPRARVLAAAVTTTTTSANAFPHPPTTPNPYDVFGSSPFSYFSPPAKEHPFSNSLGGSSCGSTSPFSCSLSRNPCALAKSSSSLSSPPGLGGGNEDRMIKRHNSVTSTSSTAMSCGASPMNTSEEEFYCILATVEGMVYMIHYPSGTAMKCTVMGDGCTFTVGWRHARSFLHHPPSSPCPRRTPSSTSPADLLLSSSASSMQCIQSILCCCVSVEAVTLCSLGAVQESIITTSDRAGGGGSGHRRARENCTAAELFEQKKEEKVGKQKTARRGKEDKESKRLPTAHHPPPPSFSFDPTSSSFTPSFPLVQIPAEKQKKESERGDEEIKEEENLGKRRSEEREMNLSPRSSPSAGSSRDSDKSEGSHHSTTKPILTRLNRKEADFSTTLPLRHFPHPENNNNMVEEAEMYFQEKYPSRDQLTDAEVLLELGNLLVALATKEKENEDDDDDDHDHDGKCTRAGSSRRFVGNDGTTAAEEEDHQHYNDDDDQWSEIMHTGSSSRIHKNNPHKPITSIFQRLLQPRPVPRQSSSSSSLLPPAVAVHPLSRGHDEEEKAEDAEEESREREERQKSKEAEVQEEEKQVQGIRCGGGTDFSPNYCHFPMSNQGMGHRQTTSSCMKREKVEEEEAGVEKDFNVVQTTVQERIYVARKVLHSYDPEEWAMLYRLLA